MSQKFDSAAYRSLLEEVHLEEEKRQVLLELIDQIEQVTAENARLRKALLRASSHNASRMSTKLKEALYE
ncbi:hypothetical protein D3C81_814630 [compost metagenome]|uniref:hypothetical protein n=1 Tax=Paenibacillus TaxID=44249 RepID=UPI000FA5538D|nr:MULTISPECIES: hypothetical protein [Paenibacillus]MUG85695.1 hypothetical protein [Paenibacillus timonensis]GIP48498.1 hypothetical protein J53TS2_20890 [Paenibacillus sp. J53TS2]